MAESVEPKVFPMIPARLWWSLRAKAKRSAPAEITAGYIAAACGISEKAAQNVLPHLRRVGLIAKDSAKPTDRLFDWREDESYPKVCATIVSEIYPSELRDALPPPDPDRSAAERWFARKMQVGESAARQMAAFYALVARADLAEAESDDGDSSPARPKAKAPSVPTGRATPKLKEDVGGQVPPAPELRSPRAPSMHIDIQIHISPQASPEQIDSIFSSMAKHLYGSK